MVKCVCYGKSGADHERFNGGCVCDKCIGEYFTCPDCGSLFDDDRENGDVGIGFCVKYAPEH